MPRKLNYKRIIEKHLGVLRKLQAPSGLFRASGENVNTGYDKAWIRDNFYECMAFLEIGDLQTVEKTYNALLKVFLAHEWKIDHAIRQKPDEKYKYIHARYHPDTFEEFWDEWGNKQNDAVGAMLFTIGELETTHGVNLLDSSDKKRIVQKLVDYLESLTYWNDVDSGIWEENEEIHASSVGSCVAGLKSIKKVQGISVNENLITNGIDTLNRLLPRESEKKFVDLALLSLIYPFNVVTKDQVTEILDNVEYHLVREHGVIRYKNDYYYNKNTDGYSEEAEWCFGFSWLALIYMKLGDKNNAKKYMNLAFKTINENDEIPELYFSNSEEHNINSPLGWAESLFVIALNRFQEKYEQ